MFMTTKPDLHSSNNNTGPAPGPNGYTITEDAEAIHTPVTGPVTPETTKRGGVDLTQGHLLKGIAILSWPIVTGAVLNWIMGGADTKMVSSLGPEAIAAVGQSQGIIFTIMAIIFAIATGTQVLVARYTGARQPDRVAEVTRQTIIISIIVGILMVPLGLVLARPSLASLGVDGQVLHFGTQYMQAFFWGSIGLIINFMVAAALQGAGDTLTPLYTLVWMNALHIASGYVMIFGVGPVPAMGVAGAAWAVVLSRGIAALYMIWVVTSGRYAITVPLGHSWRIDWPIWGKMFYIGMPSSLQGLTRNVAYLMLAAILNHTVAGTYAISGHTVAGQWGALGIFIGLAMMTAAMTAVGQNMGANNDHRAEKSCWQVVHISTISSVILGGLCIVFGHPLVRFFTDDPQAMYWGWWALLFLSASLPFATVSMAFSGGLRGAGDTMSPLWATIICTLGIGPLLAWLLALKFGMGPIGAWIGLAVSMVAQAIVTGGIFQTGKWKRIHI